MKKLALALAAVGFMMTAPVGAAPVMSDASPSQIQLSPGVQLAQLNVQIGGPGYRGRDRGYRRGFRGRRVCETRTVVRPGGRRVTTRVCR